MRAARGVYDAYTKKSTYRYIDTNGNLRSHALSAPCHTLTPPVVAVAFMVGLIDEAAELLEVRGAFDNRVPEVEEEEEEANVSYHTAPHQLAAIRLRDATLEAKLQAVVAIHRTRRENEILRLQQSQ